MMKIFDIKLSDKEELNDTVNVKPIKRKVVIYL